MEQNTNKILIKKTELSIFTYNVHIFKVYHDTFILCTKLGNIKE